MRVELGQYLQQPAVNLNGKEFNTSQLLSFGVEKSIVSLEISGAQECPVSRRGPAAM
jgi:hypothetical protein